MFLKAKDNFGNDVMIDLLDVRKIVIGKRGNQHEVFYKSTDKSDTLIFDAQRACDLLAEYREKMVR